MKKMFIIILFILIFSSFVFADKFSADKELSKYLSNLDSDKSLINKEISKAPSFVRTLIGNEKINLYIDGNVISAIFNSGLVSGISNQTLESPSLDLYVSKETIRSIANSDNKKNEAKKQLSDGKISYKTHSMITSFKIMMLKNFV